MSEFEQLYEKIHVKPPFNEEKVVPVVHRESGRICAHMRIPLSTLTDSSRSLVDKEIMIMARLTHPAVSSFKQVIYAQDAIHIVMDYHGVETLQDFIDRHRELSKIVDEATIWSIAAQLWIVSSIFIVCSKQMLMEFHASIINTSLPLTSL